MKRRKILQAGDHVKIGKLVHDVTDVGLGETLGDEVMFYSFHLRCTSIPVHVVEEDCIGRSRLRTTCLCCIAGTVTDTDYNT